MRTVKKSGIQQIIKSLMTMHWILIRCRISLTKSNRRLTFLRVMLAFLDEDVLLLLLFVVKFARDLDWVRPGGEYGRHMRAVDRCWMFKLS